MKPSERIEQILKTDKRQDSLKTDMVLLSMIDAIFQYLEEQYKKGALKD